MLFQELREKYNVNNFFDEEAITEASVQRDAPVVLLMKRSAIRIFPGGERVALYTNRKLGLTLSVPYQQGNFGSSNIPGIKINEELSFIEEDVLKRLNTILERNATEEIVFNDGSNTKVDPATSQNLLNLYNKLNETNRKAMSAKLNSNAEQFSSLAKFALDIKQE